jgi:hypothetical protein
VAYCLLTAGWVFLALTVAGNHNTAEKLACFSPFYAAAGATFEASSDVSGDRPFLAVAGWALVHALAAVWLYRMARASFDRHVGRADQPSCRDPSLRGERRRQSAPLEDSGRGETVTPLP